MTRQAIIEHTLAAINALPEEKAAEISDFAGFLLKQHEEQLLTTGIAQIMSKKNKAADFLFEEEDLYTEADIKEPYNG